MVNRSSLHSASRQSGQIVLWLVVLAAAIALPFVLRSQGLDFYTSMASRMLIYGLAAVSLNLILGYGGLVSFGHAAFVGVGAYTVGIMIHEGMPNGWVGFGAAIVVSGLFALVIGAISLRTRGVYFIMITLAFAQMIYYLVNSVKAYGGDEGLNIKRRSDFGFGIDFKDEVAFYLLALGILVICLLLIHRLMHARFGRVILAIRDDDLRAESVGFPVYRYKLILFVIAGRCAHGEPAKLCQPQPAALDAVWRVDDHGDSGWCRHSHRWRMGRAVASHPRRPDRRIHRLLAVLRGMGSFGGGAVCTARVGGAALARAEAVMAQPLLCVESLVKNFGALRATDDVSFDLSPGEIHALIGPNGAGKTSFVAQVSGHLKPDAGRIVFDGNDVTQTSDGAPLVIFCAGD